MQRGGKEFPGILSVEHSVFGWEREPKVMAGTLGLLIVGSVKVPPPIE